jgi:hypothetical protein
MELVSLSQRDPIMQRLLIYKDLFLTLPTWSNKLNDNIIIYYNKWLPLYIIVHWKFLHAITGNVFNSFMIRLG